MIKTISYGSLLLLSSALVAPAAALAQGATTSGGSAPTNSSGAAGTAPATATAPAGGDPGTPASAETPTEQVETSTPGADTTDQDIVVVGRNIPNVVRSTPEVVSLLSSADIARTGEGDIAGALQRVTGLSVVGNGFVYVRGLGDRYSLALLNGSPLPSPEPLRRVVPLDIFPTNVVASSLVQKSYSPNYPGEFGGGVINLTTKAIPTKPFLSFGISGGVDTETTAKLGYTYYGSDLDWSGFDDGTRKLPAGLSQAIKTGQPITEGVYSRADLQGFAASLRNAPTSLLQRNDDIPGNFSADTSAGTSFDVGSDGRLGIIASAGYSSTWRTRDARQQLSNDPSLASLQSDRKVVITDNRVVVNGLVGLGYEFGDQKIRWTNLFIRDTVKQGRLSAGYDANVGGADPVANPDFYGTPPLIQQNTSWFQRQLFDTQGVGEFKFGDLSVDLRGSFAESKRKSPYEREFQYQYSSAAGDYVNNLSGGQNATIAFSDLDEKLYSGGIDLAYKVPGADRMTISAGYNYNKTDRTSSRHQFQFQPPSALPFAVSQERPDYLLSDYNVYTYGIRLIELTTGQGAAAYDASLRVHAGYGSIEAEAFGSVRANVGVRYEDGRETVLPSGTGVSPTGIKNDYWLPAATITWNFAPDMQFRLHSSKTVARPQFRELARQLYQDFESDREFTGNPFLKDSTLYNAEGRYEWFFGRDQRFTLAGFYKQIKNPIEPVPFFAGGGQLRTSFTNAPKAELYGAEVEAQKYVPLRGLGGDFFASHRLVLIANYTYTKSKLKVGNELVVDPNSDLTARLVPANTIFRNGAPLTGQSDHIVNAQIGIEDTDALSQLTVLFNYASKRVTQRGPIPGPQPDFVEKPGLRIDFVARQGFEMLGANMELKFEARNLTGRKYEEFQTLGDQRVDINTYDLGRVFSLGLGVNF